MNQLIQTVFNDEITEAGLDELKAKYPANVVMDMSIDANFKQGRKIRTERNKLVEAINRKRLDVTAELKGKGDTLINEVNGIYDPLVTAFELEDKRQKDEAKRIQEELEALLNEERRRIGTIRTMASNCRGADSQVISDTIESIDLIETDVFHKDVIHEAIEAKKLALSELTQLLSDTIAREKLNAEREEMEEMRRKMAEQQAQLDRQQAEVARKQAEQEAAQKAEADHLEREKQAKLKAELTEAERNHVALANQRARETMDHKEQLEAEAIREMQKPVEPEIENQPERVESRSITGLSPKLKPNTALGYLESYQRIGDNMPDQNKRMNSPLINELCNQIERAEAVIFQAKQLMKMEKAA